MTLYRTIVADPPWPMKATGKTTRGATDSAGIYTAKSGRQIDGTWWGRHRGGSVVLPYATMSLEEIAALPVSDLAEPAAHLYVWTTNRFLEETFAIVRGWGFPNRPVTLTWGKTPMGKGFGGAFTSTSEFCLFARRGSLAHMEKQDSSWWHWSRPYENGHIAHSAKPDAFLDMVERVSPEPRIELFAKTATPGLGHVGRRGIRARRDGCRLMLPFTSHTDPGDETDFQLELLPAERECRCGARQVGDCIFAPGQWWIQYDTGAKRRPATCLRRHDPSTAPIPF